MKAVILAAGKGKRMRDLTQSTPKPLLPVYGKPILVHLIESLRKFAGVQEIMVIVGYLGEQIRDCLGDGSSLGMRVQYGVQETQNGTGKAADPAREWLNGSPFLLTNGDLMMTPSAFADLTTAPGDDGFIALKESTELVHGGAVLLDDRGYLNRIVEKAAQGAVATRYLNAGVYGMPGCVFEYTSRLDLSPRGEYEITDALNAMAADGLRIRGHVLRGDWADVRDPETLQELNQAEPH